MKPKENKTRKRPSVKWIFFGYCIILVLIMLVVIWTFRLAFLDSTYESFRIKIAENTSSTLESCIEDGKDFKKLAESIALNSDTTVTLIDGEGNIKHQIKSDNMAVEPPTASEMNEYRQLALESKNGRYVKTANSVLIYTQIIDLGDEVNGVGPVSPGKGAIVSMCRIKLMGSTIKAINFELLTVSIVMVVFAFVIATILARHVSKPLVDINKKSSKLAKGDYDVTFSESGYKEIAELGETLNYTASELGKADMARRDLIANVSHDLRTPLTMIRGYVEMMRDIPNECTKENMDVIIRESDYLTNLVKDMLDISKLDAGVTKFNISTFDMNKLLVDVVERYNAMYKQQGFTFTYKSLDEEVKVSSDKVMITNVLYNLINNAINHILDDKHIVITATKVGNRLSVHVIDKGEGIDPSKLETIWDRYYKAERNLKRESVGSGLGLSIVKTVLTKLDCTYGVKSKVNEGSDFYFDIKILGEESKDEENKTINVKIDDNSYLSSDDNIIVEKIEKD